MTVLFDHVVSMLGLVGGRKEGRKKGRLCLHLAVVFQCQSMHVYKAQEDDIGYVQLGTNVAPTQNCRFSVMYT